jgi:tetratricopeptide (TPR) repeat protein
MKTWLLAPLLLLLALGADHFRQDAQGHFRATQKYEDVYYLPPPKYLVPASLGYREALANLIWSKALIYFGEELRRNRNVNNLYRYTDAMLALDPYFKRVYRWVGSAAIYRTGVVKDEDTLKAIEYLEDGVRMFPDDGELAWDLGATYAFELVPLLDDLDARERARQKGHEFLRLAALRGAGPGWLVLATASNLDGLGKTEQAIRHLSEVYATTHDPALKSQIEARIARLRSTAYAEALRRTNEEVEAERLRDFAYVGRDLYMLLGRRPPFDGHALRLRRFDPAVESGMNEPTVSDPSVGTSPSD